MKETTRCVCHRLERFFIIKIPPADEYATSVSRIPVWCGQLSRPGRRLDRPVRLVVGSRLPVPIRSSVLPRKRMHLVKNGRQLQTDNSVAKVIHQRKRLDRPVQLHVGSRLPVPTHDGVVPTRVLRHREQSICRYRQSQQRQQRRLQQPYNTRSMENCVSIKCEIFELK